MPPLQVARGVLRWMGESSLDMKFVIGACMLFMCIRDGEGRLEKIKV